MSPGLKLLESYAKGDKEAFFGRERETDDIYRLFLQAPVVVVYGPSGTGKTSLLQCGLANRLPDTDWTTVFLRRRRNFPASTLEALTRRPARDPVEPDRVVGAVEALYSAYLRPVCLVFDQLEELFVLGDEAEVARFVEMLRALLAAKAQCRIVLSLREDYLGQMDRLERELPGLMAHRLRVEPMRRESLREVIEGTARQLQLDLQDGEQTADAIIDKLKDSRGVVQLTYLQVYLDELVTKARAESAGRTRPTITGDMVANMPLGDVLGRFLDRQTVLIQAGLQADHPGAPDDAVRRVLDELVSGDATKAPRTRAQLATVLADPLLAAVLDGLQAARIVKRSQNDFELVHDALAQRIDDSRSAVEKYRRRLEKMVSDRRVLFEMRAAGRSRGERGYLTADDLEFLKPYETTLHLTPPDVDFVRRSRAALARARIKQALRYAAVAAPLVLAVVLGGVIYEPGASEDVAKFLSSHQLPQLAAPLLSPALAVHPDNTNLLFARADAYLLMNSKDPRAERDFDRIRDLSDYKSAQLNDLCWFRTVRNGDLDKALVACKAAMELPDAIDSLALTLFKRHDYAEALAAYDKAMAKRPNDPSTLFGRSLTLRALAARSPQAYGARLPEALENRGRALARDPNICVLYAGDMGVDPPDGVSEPCLK
ncbi:AAA family ATPase [Phenylobacterium sp.]|uniref:nSTAND1 domain-containing NTPase n=1 Tax=Phenylobacterium sp. TaxID=1871053 RepID=UPI00374C9521